ncbi:MAG TPA: PspC domain-containing protein [Acidimicrobiia bacterium]|nr:PspC domain-containing protein [Acidimicrobiia bacterium]
MSSFAERRLDLDLHRRSSDRVIAGVAGGVADRLGLPAGYVRAGFVVASVLWGLGVALYVALWIATFERVEDRPTRGVASHRQVGIGLVFAGSLLALRTIGWWPGDLAVVIVATLAFGMAVLSDFDWLGRLLDPDSARPSKLRIAGGAVLLLIGLGLLAGAASEFRSLGTMTTAVVISIVGVVLVFGPWLVGMGRALTTERRERIRQEERAEMAAHLHDSVLQTLALMQRTEDPKRISTLARQQERELRSWLYGGDSTPNGQHFTSALQDAAARVEADFTIPVEVVAVGDAPLDDVGHALVSAAGEAIVNAAKHSGADEVSVYAEAGERQIDVWVADLGKSFDPEAVPADRRGLKDSIHGRMARVRGGASVDARPGEGTEIHLWAPRTDTTEGDSE